MRTKQASVSIWGIFVLLYNYRNKWLRKTFRILKYYLLSLTQNQREIPAMFTIYIQKIPGYCFP